MCSQQITSRDIYTVACTLYCTVQQKNKLIVKEYKVATCNVVFNTFISTIQHGQWTIATIKGTRLKTYSKFAIISQRSSKESRKRCIKLNFLLENWPNFYISGQSVHLFSPGRCLLPGSRHTTEAARAIRSSLPMMLCGLLSNLLCRVYKKKLNKFEICHNFAKWLQLPSFLKI